jgi:outer membrane receptor protein involved in Fe transport
LGEVSCVAPQSFHGAPCLSFSKEVADTGHTPKLTLAYKFDKERLVYATYSEGFRPGGINRVGNLPPYQADYLKNYEIGWKTSWAGNRLRFNGAFFWDVWNNFQFSFLGANSLTQIANAGNARIKGFESELSWLVADGLTLSSGFTLLDPQITENYCGALNPDGSPVTSCAAPLAPAGTQLPATSKIKANIVARYEFPMAGFDAHAQSAFVYQSSEWDDLRIVQRTALGRLPAFGTVDLSMGLDKHNSAVELFMINLFDERGELYRYTQCGSCSIVANYVVPTQPRTIGLRFSQKF